MEISCGKEGLVLKNAKDEILLGETPKVNGVNLNGKGEYEVGGVSARGLSENCYFFTVSGTGLTFLRFEEALSPSDLEIVSQSDILLLSLEKTGKEKFSKLVNVVSQVDPRLLVVSDHENSSSFVKTLGVKEETLSQVKVTPNLLLPEERKVVILQCKV